MANIPLRTKLTLLYGLVLGVALALIGVLTYTLLAHELERELDDTLGVRSAALHRALNVTDERFDIGQLTTHSLEIPINEFATPGIYIQVLDHRGLAVVASANLHDQRLPVDPGVIADGLAAKPTLVTIPAGQGAELRVLTTPMIHGQNVVGLLQVAASLSTVQSALRVLFYQLTFGIAAAWLLALVLSWWITGRALRPVRAISATAEHIAATGDLAQRIAYGGAKDELGALTATLNHMLVYLDRSFAAHRQFVADSSHQLGTPLTIIRGNADLLAQDIPPEDREECIAAIRTEVERMDKVIGDLLTLAQLDARTAIHWQAVRLDTLARQMAAQAQSLAGERRIVVEAHPMTVQGDPDRLAELLLNLLHNAVKYSPDGTKILVRVEPADAGGSRDVDPNWAWLTVADQGSGIPSQDLDRVFDRFYRVNRPDGARGAGLGLAIVKAIAEAHGGKVAVHSTPGQGSKFSVLLPAVD